MGVAGKLRTAICAVLFVLAAAARAADCTSAFELISQHGIQPNRPAGPVAWNGTHLGIARPTFGEPLWFSLHTTELAQVAPERQVTTSTYGGQAHLVSDGADFGLFFLSQSQTIVYQRIDASGSPLGSEMIVGKAHGTYPNQQIDVAWDPARGAYLVAYTVPNGVDVGLWLTAIRPNGSIVSDERIQFFIALDPQPHLSVGSNGVVAVSWIRQDAGQDVLYLTLIDRNGAPISTSPIAAGGRQARLGTTGSTFALGYQANASGGTTEIRWVRFDTAGKFIGADARLVPPRGIDVAPVSILWNPTLSEWALTYVDALIGIDAFPGDYRLRRLTPTGGVISDVLFTPDITKNILASRDPLVWTGSAYFSTIFRYFSTTEGSDSYLVRHCTVDATLSASTRTPLMQQLVTFSASVTGGTPPYTYSWDFGDLTEHRTEASPVHSYTRLGTYTVTLTVTDAAGETAVRTMTVTVVATVRGRAVRH
jgi:hypothetical protein